MESGKMESRNVNIEAANRMYACWLNAVPGIGNRTIEKFLTLCRDERAVYEGGEALWREVLNKRQLEQMRLFALEKEPAALYEEVCSKGIRCVTLEDEEYPLRLRQIPDPPRVLYVKGQLPGPGSPCVAVVGARDCSEYGSFVASGIGTLLGENKIQVISGMARGIDGISQRAAMQAGGMSFGVLGCGVDVCYPASNRKLYEKLCEKGGVLSAYPPGTEPRSGNFPPRNRIVSGLSDVVIVVEARSKSGTIITVDMALEQGKDVYVVPGRITDRLSDGCNKLLKQGAELFLSPEEFLQELRERWNGKAETAKQKASGCLEWSPAIGLEHFSRERREIYDALGLDPVTPEQLQEKLPIKYPISKLVSLLMGLCVEGVALQVSPGCFVRRG